MTTSVCGCRLKHTVAIQRKGTATKSATGEEVFTWQPVATVRAWVRDTVGREFLRGEAQIADVTTAVTMRYRTGITPAMRVVYGARVLDVKYALDLDGRKRWLDLLCREVVQ